MVLGGAAVVGLDQLRSDNASGSASVIQQSVPQTNSNISGAVEDVSDLYTKVRPSVVTITGSSSRTGAGGVGSGIVIDKQGHILTNNHVVSGFDTLDVTFADGNSFAAKVIGTDPATTWPW
jgi:putative serine protease PepD